MSLIRILIPIQGNRSKVSNYRRLKENGSSLDLHFGSGFAKYSSRVLSMNAGNKGHKLLQDLLFGVARAGCAIVLGASMPAHAHSTDAASVNRSNIDSVYWSGVTARHVQCFDKLPAHGHGDSQPEVGGVYLKCMSETVGAERPLTDGEKSVALVLAGQAPKSDREQLLTVARQHDLSLTDAPTRNVGCPAEGSPLYAIAIASSPQAHRESLSRGGTCFRRAEQFVRVLVRACAMEMAECRKARLDYAAGAFERWRRASKN